MVVTRSLSGHPKTSSATLQALAPTATDELPISELVGCFYGRIRQDPLLAPVFTAAIGETDAAWAAHLARLRDFWSSVMQGSGRYHGDPFSAHLRLPNLTPAMFDRWLDVFQATCREVLPPDEAAAFGSRATRIARSLRLGLFERLPARQAPYQASGPPAG
jgi:hemoglobin